MKITRRDFVGAASFAAAGCICGCASNSGVTPDAAPPTILRKAAFRRPGARLRMGFVGVGGRGGANLREFLALGEEVTAICDVDAGRLAAAAKLVESRFPKARRYQDWRMMLERETDLDAVVISTPDHMHCACAVAAMQRGCHVYVEKPLVRTWWEAERFREVAQACGVVTQMGNNGNGMDWQRRGVEVLQSGLLGDVGEIYVTTDRPIWPQGIVRPAGADPVPPSLDWNLWLGVAPKRPYRKGVYHAFNWRGWFDFGTGALGDIGCHAMSLFWRGLDLRETLSVETVASTDKFAETFPKATTVKLVVRSGRQSAPVTIYWYDGKSSPDPETCRRITGGKRDSIGGGTTVVVGAKGTWMNQAIMMAGEEKFVRQQDHAAAREIAQSIPRVKGHHWEFAEAVRGQLRAFSDIDHSVPLTEAVLLGCISQRVPGRLEWNQAEGRFSNSEEANALLYPHVRAGWEI